MKALQTVSNEVGRLSAKVDLLAEQVATEETRLMATLDEVLADVTDESTRIDGLITLTNGLRDQIKALAEELVLVK